MPAGSVTLLEAVKGASEQLKRGVIMTIIQESPIIEQLPWMTISGNALKHTVEQNLPSVQFRPVNATYSRSYGTDVEHYWGVAILGGEVFVDNYLLKVVSNQVDLKARQYAKLAKANARTFDRYFFDGDGTANTFKGVNALITEGFGQVTDNGASGLQIGANWTAANGTKLLNKMDEAHDLLRTGPASAVLLNRFTRRAITRSARESVSGVSLIDVGNDAFGRQVVTWNDVPLRIIGDDETATAILGLDEPLQPGGGANSACSMYFIRYGEDLVSGLLGMGGSFEVQDFGETEAAPGHLGRLEWYPGVAVFDKYAIVRVMGFIN
jgi:hypothetical protein